MVKKASTRTASRWPKMRVADVGTQVHCSLPGGRSRTRPWRFVTKTSHLRVGLTVVVGITPLLDMRSCLRAFWSLPFSVVAELELSRSDASRSITWSEHRLAEVIGQMICAAQ